MCGIAVYLGQCQCQLELDKIKHKMKVESQQLSPEKPAGRGQENDGENKLLPLAQEKAYQSCEYAIQKEPELADKTDRDVYNWLKENGTADYKFPDFETWSRYVRAGRKHYGIHRNLPRTGREIKAPKASDDPDLVQQISNQYTQKRIKPDF